MAATLPARKFHLLPTDELPAELGDVLKPDRPGAGRAWEAAPADAEAVARREVPRGSAWHRQSRRPALKPLQHVLRSGTMCRTFSSFPLNGIKENTNSKGFTVEASELPDAFW